jgi:hypothetical protein
VVGTQKGDFTLDHHPLLPGTPALGSVAVIPWDSATFGFTVGDYKLAERGHGTIDADTCCTLLEDWATANNCELISCDVPADHHDRIALLSSLGFVFVDFRLRVTLPQLRMTTLPGGRIPVRPAEQEDGADIERIARTAFHHGRYHADPRFPGVLADLRYQRWITNALTDPGLGEVVYVIGPPGSVRGFYHAVVTNGLAHLRLAAVDADSRGGIVGFNLYVGMLEVLREMGARQATGVISTANVEVMNVFGFLGFRFSHPEAEFHWHARQARHLIGGNKGGV